MRRWAMRRVGRRKQLLTAAARRLLGSGCVLADAQRRAGTRLTIGSRIQIQKALCAGGTGRCADWWGGGGGGVKTDSNGRKKSLLHNVPGWLHCARRPIGWPQGRRPPPRRRRVANATKPTKTVLRPFSISVSSETVVVSVPH